MKKENYQNPRTSAFYQERTPNYRCNPVLNAGFLPQAFCGYPQICQALEQALRPLRLAKEQVILVIDCYDGVSETDLYESLIQNLSPDYWVSSLSCRYPEAYLSETFARYINPADSTYGVFGTVQIDEYFDPEKVRLLQKRLAAQKGLSIVCGVAAGRLVKGDLLVYGNISRMELENRLAKGLDNWGAGNHGQAFSEKEKRGVFLDWRALDPHKRDVLGRADFVMDCSRADAPVMLAGADFRQAILGLSRRPFQLVPLFMPAVWGGKWLQKITGAGKEQPNVGWAINGYLDAQSVKIECRNAVFEFPGNDLIQLAPREILGEKIFYFWGYKCPIHTNILDTWEGGNLSLQVHPTTAYAMEAFNAARGHHESYYILDTKGNKSVYLGLKEGAHKEEFIKALEEAQISGQFDETRYVNQVPVKKHDHLSIPGGTLHCSGEGNVVLEIDEFWFATLKLWDWGRVDLDGRPRPIHIHHGRHCLQENFRGRWVQENLVGKQPVIAQGEGWTLEDSSTMPYEPMKVLRYWFSRPLHLSTDGVIHIVVLVEGESAVIESPEGSFDPFVIHYAEATFLPAACRAFCIRPQADEIPPKELGLLDICYPM